MSRYRRYDRKEHEVLGEAAVAWAEHVLSLFEAANPDDGRPREALEVCRTWLRTGVFKMTEIRRASLAAHAAARSAQGGDAARWAARAAGQAVATAHVPQHAYGAAYYALKVVAAVHGADGLTHVEKEREWQSRWLPRRLRDEFLSRVIAESKRQGVSVTIDKTGGF